jgi:CHAT domain
MMAALDRMPGDDPETARALAAVGLQVLSAGASRRSVLQQQRLVGQLERLIGRLAPDEPVRPFIQCTYWALVSLHANLEHQPDLADSALAELMSCADSVPVGNPWRPHLLASVGFALIDRHGMGGEMRHLDQAGTYVSRAFKAIDPAGPYAEGTPGHGALLFLRGHLEVLRYYYDRAPERLPKALDDLERAVELVGPDNPASSFMTSSIQTARTMRARMAAPAEGMFLGEDEKAAFDTLLTAAEQIGRDHPEYPLLIAQGAAGLMLRGLSAGDRALINRALPALASACSVAGLANRERTRLLEAHGFALLTRHALTGNQRDLSNAIDRLEEARRAVEQEPGSPYGASVLQRLASAYRTRGDRARGDVDRATALGLAGLQELVGDVLLQDTDENALYRARQGTNEATEMARWLLQRDRAAEALNALELGRGMVLHAASSGAGVETALRESGHAALAHEWANAAADDSDLRYRTMLALEQSPAQARLLSSPSAADIAAALTQVGADALVYLLPQDEDGHGFAVLVDRDAAVRMLPLPGLRADAGSPVGDFLAARRNTEAAMAIPGTSAKAAAEAAARPFWLAALGALCDWAWRVALGRVLSALPVRTGSRELRVVLVPGGELGLVPWHAARRPGGSRYACQEAIISYAASARQFLDAARRRPRRWAEEPVLISDSSPSLYITAVSIAGLHAHHYEKAKVFGYAHARLDAAVPGAAAVTPDDVLAALPHPGHPGASLVHVGCHGQVEVPVLNSSLLLGAGEDGKQIRIEVRDILQRARQGRSAVGEVAGGLVVLASCFSDVTETDYDEALTLSTGFLSAGAIGVVGAGWMVGEAETAVFMTLFHHFLNGSHPSPASALRETQLWMLDTARDVPGGLPDAIRLEAATARESGVNPYASPETWAAFSYQGR